MPSDRVLVEALSLEIQAAQQRIAELEGEKTTLAKALRVTYEAHQDIHPCTLCYEMWCKLETLAALAPEGD